MISVKRETKEVMQTIRSFIKWVLIAHLTGAAGGLVGSAFHLSVSHATAFRLAHPWMLYLRKTGDEEVCDKPSASEKFHNLFNKKK